MKRAASGGTKSSRRRVASATVQPVLDAIARTAARLCEAHDALILEVEGVNLRQVAKYGRLPSVLEVGHARPVSRGFVSGRAVLDRKIVHIHDIVRTGKIQFAEARAARRVAGTRTRTILATPLLRNDAAVGVIVVRRTTVRPFTAKQIALLKTFADQAAIAIENARLSQELQDRNQRLTEALERETATSEILRTISSSPTDIQPTLDAVADSAARLCSATDALIRRIEDGKLRRVAQSGSLPLLAETEFLPISASTAVGQMVLEHRTVHVHDVLAENKRGNYLGMQPAQRRIGVRTALAVPLVKNATVIGGIVVRRTEVLPFTDTQIALLQTFADQAVIAIENVRLFKELDGRNRDLTEALEQQTATSEILRVISISPTDVQPVFAAVATSAARLCDAFDAAIHRVDGDALHLVAHHGPIPPDTVLPLEGTLAGRTVSERRAMHVADMQAEAAEYPESSSFARRGGFRTILSVPLLRGFGAIGTITIRRTEVRPFTDRQAELLKTFADQAVIAIENVRLFKELEARNRDLTEALDQQTATSEILRVISGSPTDVAPIFDIIAESAWRLCAATRAAVYRYDGGLVHFVAHHGFPAEALGVARALFPSPPNRGNAASRAIFDRAIVHIPDVVADAEHRQRDFARAVGIRSLLGVPMLHDEQPVGAVVVGRADPGPFSESQISLLQTFADQAVIAIENVRLFNELGARNRELTEALEQQTATSEVLKVIGRSTFDLQPVFETLAENAVRLCEGHQAFIFRFDGQTLRVVASHNISPELRAFFEANPIVPGRGSVAGRAALDRRTIHIEDVRTDPEYTWGAREVDPLRTVLTIPMLRAGEVLGVIVVNRLEVRPFSDSQIALVETFADQAAIAIENARLLRELQARNADLTETLEQQTATAEILRVISTSPTNLEPVLDAVVKSAARFCGAPDASVFRLDGEALRADAHHGPVSQPTGFLVPVVQGSVAGRSVLERQAVGVTDLQVETEEFPEGSALARQTGQRATLSVPLLREGAPIGVILLRRAEAVPFTDKQITLLQTFADQAVIAIENVRLFKELEGRNRDLTEALEQQTATGEILRAISQSHTDAQPVFEAIADSALRLFRAWTATVFRVEGEFLYPLAARGGLPGSGEALQYRQPQRITRDFVSGRCIVDRSVVHVADLQTDPDAPSRTREIAPARGFRAALCVPLLRDAQPIGTIAVSRAEPGRFSDGEIALLKTFADQAVIAIENVRLFQELQARTAQLTRSVGELTALGEVSRALSSTLDLETVLNTIVVRAAQLAGTDGCSIYEYDEEAEQFDVRATHNLEPELVEVLRARPLRKGEGALGRLAETREPIQVPDIRQEGTYASHVRAVLLRLGHRALMAVPLLRGERLMGGLTVNKKTPGEFPPETVEMLKTFATQSALAINNARLFREIEDKGRQLEIASRHKSQFLANMSHELRTPLNAILGYTELIADNIYGEVSERMREVLERVDKSGRHLLGLINDILDLSKIEAGQLTLALAPYAMDGVAQTVATQVGALAAEKQLGFEVVLAEDLPIGQGDERRLTQVLLNLVGNAIKFTDAGKVVVRVGTSADAYVVAVTDTGPGIAEGDLEKIFEEFQQADTTRAKAKGGTGLGLAISRRIVEMHGGRLWVESTLGQGSTFSFTVPVNVEQQVTVQRQPPRS